MCSQGSKTSNFFVFNHVFLEIFDYIITALHQYILLSLDSSSMFTEAKILKKFAIFSSFFWYSTSALPIPLHPTHHQFCMYTPWRLWCRQCISLRFHTVNLEFDCFQVKDIPPKCCLCLPRIKIRSTTLTFLPLNRVFLLYFLIK